MWQPGQPDYISDRQGSRPSRGNDVVTGSGGRIDSSDSNAKDFHPGYSEAYQNGPQAESGGMMGGNYRPSSGTSQPERSPAGYSQPERSIFPRQ